MWQTMDNAPRNGDAILVKTAKGKPIVVCWSDLSDGEGWFAGYRWNGKHLFIDPVKWMPIPD